MFVYGAAHDGVDHEKKADEADERGYLNAACAEYVGVEYGLGRTGTRHKEKTDDDDDHACGEQDEVDAVKCKISSIHDELIGWRVSDVCRCRPLGVS